MGSIETRSVSESALQNLETEHARKKGWFEGLGEEAAPWNVPNFLRKSNASWSTYSRTPPTLRRTSQPPSMPSSCRASSRTNPCPSALGVPPSDTRSSVRNRRQVDEGRKSSIWREPIWILKDGSGERVNEPTREVKDTSSAARAARANLR